MPDTPITPPADASLTGTTEDGAESSAEPGAENGPAASAPVVGGETVTRLTDLLVQHRLSGVVSSREGWVECECGEQLPCELDRDGYAKELDDEDRTMDEHRAAVLAQAGVTFVETPAADKHTGEGLAACDMRHQEPYDFAWCLTHDTTFPLGGACKFNGREPWEVYADEAQEQRGLKVRAEMRAEYAETDLATLRDRFENLASQWEHRARQGLGADGHSPSPAADGIRATYETAASEARALLTQVPGPGTAPQPDTDRG